MADPLSIAASVAGLISLGGVTAKLFYQFIASIVDAPKEVQAITSSLYGVNIALCQIQTLLLDLSYASQTASEDLNDLECSVSCCLASFSVVKKELESVCSAASEKMTAKRVWHQVKYVFQQEGLRDALAGLESQKGTLQMIMAALNSKSMARVLQIVRDAEQSVQRNTHVLQRLEVKITRALQAGLGRSHVTTSSWSLDSICSQEDIGRLLTDSGSALILSLTDMADDSASIVLVPDSLSGVESLASRILFASVESAPESETASEASDAVENTDPMQSVDTDAVPPVRVQSRQRVAVDSFFNLNETIQPQKPAVSSEGESLSKPQRQAKCRTSSPDVKPIKEYNDKVDLHTEHLSTAQRIMLGVKSNRLLKSMMRKDKWAAAVKLFDLNLNLGTGVLGMAASVSATIQMAISAYQSYQMLAEASSTNAAHLRNLKMIEARFQRYVLLSTPLSRSIYSPSTDHYFEHSLRRAGDTIKVYADFLLTISKAPSKRSSLVLALQRASGRMDELWGEVRESMDELDRAINFHLLNQLHINIERSQADANIVHNALSAKLDQLGEEQHLLLDAFSQIPNTGGPEHRRYGTWTERQARGEADDSEAPEQDVSGNGEDAGHSHLHFNEVASGSKDVGPTDVSSQENGATADEDPVSSRL